MNLLKGTWVQGILALVMALLTYFYIHNEIVRTKEVKEQTDPSYKLIKLTAKQLPLKVRLATTPPEGYKIVTDEVRTSPQKLTVIGPEALLEEASGAETALLDIGESKRTTTKKIAVESVAGIRIIGEPVYVDVTVPIKPVEVVE